MSGEQVGGFADVGDGVVVDEEGAVEKDVSRGVYGYDGCVGVEHFVFLVLGKEGFELGRNWLRS
jgi:hypothetical protein